MKELIKDPHILEADEAIKLSSSSSHGLSSDEVLKRVNQFGLNEIKEKKPISLFSILFRQLKSALVVILVIASIISFLVGQIVDMWVIISAILLDVSIGFTQEFRAQKAINSLKKIIVVNVKVFRDGDLRILPSKELVPGDVIVLEEGDSIPADGRILKANNFRTIEASLTGESIPTGKSSEKLTGDIPMADQENMVWKGTFVAGGYAEVLVTGTGQNTKIGDISETLDTIVEEKTNFAKKTTTLAKQMSLIALISAGAIFVVGYFLRNFELEEVALASIAALVAAIPEGLNVVFSIVLAIGAKRMVKRKALIRQFTATETLGTVSTILTDKTGTLTQNSLTVKKIFVPGSADIDVSGEGWSPIGNFMQNERIIDQEEYLGKLKKLLEISIGSNNASIRHDKEKNAYELMGDPTEGALLVLGRKGRVDEAIVNGNKIDDQPFDSELKFRASLLGINNTKELFVTGAPEKVLDRCTSVLINGEVLELTAEIKQSIHQKLSDWTSESYRVIALAYSEYDKDEIIADSIQGLTLAGIVGMIDPPRTDVKESVEKCKRAGIRVVMVTGDHVNTAVAIARATGIIENDGKKVVALTEQQLERLDEDEFDDVIQKVSVFARLTPKMKMRIATRLQHMGNLIAMTGDGVNDAPALKQADVGVAMGIAGTDTAREASDVVLADDNFATIVNAIEEGRIVFSNARKTSYFLITTNVAESIILVLSIALGFPLMLTATQLLWLNLVTDGITDVALATEKGHTNVMNKKPISKNERILSRTVWPFMFINVILMTILTISAFYYFMDVSLEKARTAAFIVLSFTQLFNVYNMRSLTLSVFEIGFFSNQLINGAVGLSLILVLVITELPALANIFQFESLNVVEYLILFAISSIVFWCIELYKIANRKKTSSGLY